ncbi:hypothetical protein L596_029189 [Steinernema carpocapsae]|uniref:[histone H3]-lysine(4) N-trimethyltransferase n=1 Tax=Steinernema carpocapsae TaxID=34508 RepID=A0A4U5LTW6_STECR|nr:hypothetical protein L596_029189 [Steinernema carpocapsae]
MADKRPTTSTSGALLVKKSLAGFVIPKLSQKKIAAETELLPVNEAPNGTSESKWPSDPFFYNCPSAEIVGLDKPLPARAPPNAADLPSLREKTIDDLMADVITKNRFLRTEEDAKRDELRYKNHRSPQHLAEEALKKVNAKNPFVPKKLNLERSFVHRFGMVAEEPIQRGEVVIEYIGEIVSEDDANQREHLYTKHGVPSSYLFQLNSKEVIDARMKANFARFINHSCDPNCESTWFKVGGKERIFLYAIRDIAENEELFIDYAFKADSSEESLRCLCKSYNCRGDMRLIS